MARSFTPLEHYPDRWRELKEIHAISDTDILPLSDGNVDVHTLQHIWDCLDKELNNAFIISYGENEGADEYACSRWESMLGIKPLNGASLDDRQFTIYTRLFQMTPYSLEKIERLLEAILGEKQTSITPNVETQTVKVVLSLSSRFKIDAITELMEAIVPANMILIIDVDNTTHRDLAKYTHEQLEPYTHQEITITEL